MNILYDYQIFTRQTYGGISRYFYELMRHGLSDPTSSLSCFQGFHFNRFDIAAYSKRFEAYFGFRHNKIPKTGVLLSMLNAVLFPVWCRFVYGNKRCIYHPTWYSHSDLDWGGQCRRIVTIYDMIHEKMPQYLPGAEKVVLQKRRAVEKADRLIAISQSTKNDILEIYGLPEEKVSVVYLAADALPDSLQSGAAAPGTARPYFLYVGERGGYKNFRVLLKAFSAWRFRRDHSLLCVGGTNWTAEERQILRELGLDGEVKLLRGVSDAELAHIYRGAIAYVVTSLYEGFGIPSLEALSLGVPVLAARTSSLPEVLGDAAIYFSPDSAEELLNGMEALASSEELREKLRAKGATQSGKFSWARTTSQTYAIYREVY